MKGCKGEAVTRHHHLSSVPGRKRLPQLDHERSGGSSQGFGCKASTCAGIIQPVIWGPLILERLISSVAGRLDSLDPKESSGVLQITWAVTDLVQASCTMPAFPGASIKSQLHPSSSLVSDFTAHTKQSDTLKTGTRSPKEISHCSQQQATKPLLFYAARHL